MKKFSVEVSDDFLNDIVITGLEKSGLLNCEHLNNFNLVLIKGSGESDKITLTFYFEEKPGQEIAKASGYAKIYADAQKACIGNLSGLGGLRK